jgi:hypothetical protein
MIRINRNGNEVKKENKRMKRMNLPLVDLEVREKPVAGVRRI